MGTGEPRAEAVPSASDAGGVGGSRSDPRPGADAPARGRPGGHADRMGYLRGSVRTREPVPGASGGAAVEVRVELKPGVFDAEADSVARSLKLLGIEGLAEVQTARLYRLTFPGATPDEARTRAERAVERLLANPVVHRVAITAV